MIEWITLGILIILIVLVILIFMRMNKMNSETTDPSAKIEAMVKDEFLKFQKNINQGLSEAKKEVSNSKDAMNKQAIDTLKTIQAMGKTIHTIAEQQVEAEKLGQSLRDLLQKPQPRGSYGETILEEMLENILPKGIWECQCTVGGSERVDAIIKIKDVMIPVDAKFPRDNYLNYMDAKSDDDKARCWKDYETAVKTQIKSISDKYVKPEMGTTDFALMFIPSELIYYETIAEKNYMGETSVIYQYAQKMKVIPVSPNTFYAFLQVVILGIKNIEIIESAKELQDGLTKLERHFELFYKQYELIGKGVGKAAEAYRLGDVHIDRFKRQLDDTIKLEAFSEKDAPLLSDTVEESDGLDDGTV